MQVFFRYLREWLPWRGAWQPTPVFLPREFHGQRSLAGYSPWAHKESDTTERLYNKQQQKQTKQLLRHGENSNSHTLICLPSQLRKAAPWCLHPIRSPPGTSGPPVGTRSCSTLLWQPSVYIVPLWCLPVLCLSPRNAPTTPKAV